MIKKIIFFLFIILTSFAIAESSPDSKLEKLEIINVVNPEFTGFSSKWSDLLGGAIASFIEIESTKKEKTSQIESNISKEEFINKFAGELKSNFNKQNKFKAIEVSYFKAEAFGYYEWLKNDKAVTNNVGNYVCEFGIRDLSYSTHLFESLLSVIASVKIIDQSGNVIAKYEDYDYVTVESPKNDRDQEELKKIFDGASQKLIEKNTLNLTKGIIEKIKI